MSFKLKIVILLILIVSGLSCLSKPVSAHPLDVTRTELIVPTDLTDSRIDFEIYLPWTEAAYLVGDQQLIASPSATMLRSHKDTYVAYLQDKLFLINEGEQCIITETYIPDQPDEQIILGSGLQINGNFDCPNTLGSVLISNQLFLEIFPLQTNIVTIYSGTKDNVLKGALLTQTTQEDYIDLSNPEATTSAAARPSNTSNTKLTDQLSSKFMNIQNTSIPLAIAITFLLGLLHTLEAGHSKSILAALVINRKVNLRQSLIYASVFTTTHVADIILMGIILVIANSFIDVFDKLPYLQIASLYSLLFIAFYLTLQHLVHFIQQRFLHGKHHHHHEHSHDTNTNTDFKHQLMIGFVSGLAPCLFGWSIFMLVLSTKTIWTVIPLVLSFGLGIFLALISIVFLIHKLKNRLISEDSLLAQLSPLASSLILLGIALYQILQ